MWCPRFWAAIRRGWRGDASVLDLRARGAAEALVAEVRPDVVIHTAYVQSGPDLRAITVEGSAAVARAAQAAGARLVHLSIGERGEQIIDLEALANHKGSAFGWIGEAPQPSVELFENLLFEKIRSLDAHQRVWVENESRSVGTVFLPEGFWQNLKRSPLVNIEIPTEIRIQKLIAAYAHCGKEVLIESFKKIEKKLGYNHCKAAIDAVNQGDLAAAASIALHYYDKTYGHSLAHNQTAR